MNQVKCRYTGVVGNASDMAMRPNIVPQVSKSIYFADTPEAHAAYKFEIKAFNENDANCNTCKHFKRMKSDNAKGSSSSSNFVYGDCLNVDGKPEILPNQAVGFKVMVHVADFIGQPCHELRD